MRQTIVVLLCRLNLPAHNQVHNEDNSNLLRHATNIRESAKNICENL